MGDKLDPEMMGRTNPGMKGAIKNGNGNMHGNGHHPLPPDGMYHVSDGNGHGMNGFNGTMTNGMDNGNALAAALTDKVRLQLQQQMEEDLEDLLPPPPSMHDHLPTSTMQQSVVFNNKQGPQLVVQSPGSNGEGSNRNNFGQDNSQMSSLSLPGRLPPSTCV